MIEKTTLAIENLKVLSSGLFPDEDTGEVSSYMEMYDERSFSSKLLPSRQARRMSEMSRKSVSLALETSSNEKIDFAVFCSKHGEQSNTCDLMKNLVQGEELSPTKFSQSVHNTSSGLYSIIAKKNIPMETISAGEDSFVMSLISAIAFLKNNSEGSVLYVFSDEATPDLLLNSVDKKDTAPIYVAMILKNQSSSLENAFSLSVEPFEKTGTEELTSLGTTNQVCTFISNMITFNSEFHIKGSFCDWKYSISKS